MDGRKKQFEDFFLKNHSIAIGYTRKKVMSLQEAEDIVMDTFSSCFKKLNSFNDSIASFGTWFYVALNNRIKNYYRDSKETYELDDGLESEKSFENEIIEAERLSFMRNELAKGLETLNETQRTIIILKYFKNKNASEIAELVSMTPGNIRITLMRAVDKLKKYFLENNITWE